MNRSKTNKTTFKLSQISLSVCLAMSVSFAHASDLNTAKTKTQAFHSSSKSTYDQDQINAILAAVSAAVNQDDTKLESVEPTPPAEMTQATLSTQAASVSNQAQPITPSQQFAEQTYQQKIDDEDNAAQEADTAVSNTTSNDPTITNVDTTESNSPSVEVDETADDYVDFGFASSFLRLANPGSVDLSHFSRSNSVLPGRYKADVYINRTMSKKSADIEVRSRENGSNFVCITPALVYAINFNQETIPEDFKALLAQNSDCLDLENALLGTEVKFNSNELLLDISVAQIYTVRTARGEVDPSLWDSGVKAGVLGYSLNVYNSESGGNNTQSAYLSLNTGVNIGAWYFRQNGNFTWSSDSGEVEYTSLNAYAQRDIPAIKGRLILGQTNTRGSLFSTVPILGAQLSSDERMLPSSQRGYAPVIQGVAKTNAKVQVYQGEQLIYETQVSPGEFLINDLYPSGYGGNLDVIVKESDGTEQRFAVAYQSIAELMRPGFAQYSVSAGVYRTESLLETPEIFEATYQRGLTNNLTGYVGLQGNEDYYAGQLGLAFGTFIGSFSVDVTQSYTNFDDAYEDQQGQSYQLRYSKNISATGSNLSLAAYRYSTEGYADYTTAMAMMDDIARGNEPSNQQRSRNRFVLSLNQRLPQGWGALYGNAIIEDFWSLAGRSKQYQIGYNNSFGSVSWGLNAALTQDANGNTSENYSANMSLPLASSEYTQRPRLRITLNQNDKGVSQQQVGINGSLGEYSQFNYGLGATNSSQGSTSVNANASYTGRLATVSASASFGETYSAQSIAVAGSMVAHAGGVTLSPYSGTTYAIIEAKGAEGATISGYRNIRVDSNGYAIMPYMSAYQMNNLSIDPATSINDVELENTLIQVAPYDKAIVHVKFDAKSGYPVLINGTLNGDPLPFGASVYDLEGNIVGAVGQAGQIYARVEGLTGQLEVVWGSTATEECVVEYSIKGEKNSMDQIDAICTQ